MLNKASIPTPHTTSQSNIYLGMFSLGIADVGALIWALITCYRKSNTFMFIYRRCT